MTVTFTSDDEGKKVVDASGRTLGLVTKIEEGTAYVDPDPSVADTVKADLGWGDADADEYTVHQDAVATREEGTLRLRGEL